MSIKNLLKSLAEGDTNYALKGVLEEPPDESDKETLDAIHTALWDETKEVFKVYGECLSVSDFLWVLRAKHAKYFEDLSIKFERDSFTIPAIWRHEDGVCISRMCLTRLMHALEGTHFRVLCDPKFTERTPAWIRRAYEVVECIRARCYFFCVNPLVPGLMNDDVYVEQETKETKRFKNSHLDSDDEGEKDDDDDYVTIVPSNDTLKRVNCAFWYDCNSMLTCLDLNLHVHVRLKSKPVKERVKIKTLREWIYRLVETMRPENVLAARRDWQYSLMVDEASRRIFKRKLPHNTACKDKSVLVSKNIELVDDVPKSVDEMFVDKSNMRLSTDAMFKYVSQQKRHDSGGDVFETVYVPDPVYRGTTGPRIFRNRVSNKWIAWFSDEDCFELEYATAAFIFLRKEMTRRKLSPKVAKYVNDRYAGVVNISYYDQYF